MNYILKLLNINRTYLIIVSLIFFLFGSMNKDKEKTFKIKDALFSFFPTALIIEKAVNFENINNYIVKQKNITDSEVLLSDNSSIKSDFTF